jgi:putative oxidoreductase
MASVTEVGSGFLLILGLLTSLAAAGVIGVMVVAWITNHLRNGFFIFREGEGWEYVMVLTVCGVVIAVLGPGSWSLDSALGVTGLWGWTGLWIALVGGIGGSGLLLLTSWRPKTDLSAEPYST